MGSTVVTEDSVIGQLVIAVRAIEHRSLQYEGNKNNGELYFIAAFKAEFGFFFQGSVAIRAACDELAAVGAVALQSLDVCSAMPADHP